MDDRKEMSIIDQLKYYNELCKTCQNILAKFGIIANVDSDYIKEIVHEAYIIMMVDNISFYKAVFRVKSKNWYARKTTPIIDSIDNTMSITDDNFQAVENRQVIENYRQKVINKSSSNKQRKLNKINAILAEMEG